MTNVLFRQLILITGLILVSYQVKAASITAIAPISANIVPISSLGLSDINILDKKHDAHSNEIQTKANSAIIRTSLFKSKYSTKLKIETYHNNGIAYDISVSPFMPLTESLSNKTNDSRTYNNIELLKNTNKQEFEIEVIQKDNVVTDTELNFGYVEINVNYN